MHNKIAKMEKKKTRNVKKDPLFSNVNSPAPKLALKVF